jgi:hypothetical protein
MARRITTIECRDKCHPKTIDNRNELMKTTIALLATTVLAAFALTGCDQNAPSNSTGAPSTNSSVSVTTNALPDLNANAPASTNK